MAPSEDLGAQRTPCKAERYRPDWFAREYGMTPACFWCLDYSEKVCRGCDGEPFDLPAYTNKLLASVDFRR